MGEKTDLKPGDKAPVFTLTDQEGKMYRLADHIGKVDPGHLFLPEG